MARHKVLAQLFWRGAMIMSRGGACQAFRVPASLHLSVETCCARPGELDSSSAEVRQVQTWPEEILDALLSPTRRKKRGGVQVSKLEGSCMVYNARGWRGPPNATAPSQSRGITPRHLICGSLLLSRSLHDTWVLCSTTSYKCSLRFCYIMEMQSMKQALHVAIQPSPALPTVMLKTLDHPKVNVSLINTASKRKYEL
jgi:hypothetical protein